MAIPKERAASYKTQWRSYGRKIFATLDCTSTITRICHANMGARSCDTPSGPQSLSEAARNARREQTQKLAEGETFLDIEKWRGFTGIWPAFGGRHGSEER